MPLQQLATNQTTGNSASGGSNSLVDLLQEKLPKCTHCSKCFTEPKQLDCLHSFCKECLKTCLIGNNKIRCFICNDQAEVKQGLDGLKDNLLLKSIGEEFHDLQNQSIKCNNCESGKSATMACIDCTQYLCEDCFRGHQFMKTMRDAHKSFNVNDMSNLEQFKEFQRQKYAVCSEHKDNKKLLFCVEDKIAICHTCACSTQHKNHSFMPVVKHVDTQTSKIVSEIGAIDKNKDTIEKENVDINDKLQKAQTRLQAALDYLVKEEAEAIAMVKQRFAEIKKECSARFEKLIAKYNKCLVENLRKMSKMEGLNLEKDIFSLLPSSVLISSASKYLEHLKAQKSCLIAAAVPDVKSSVVTGVNVNKNLDITARYENEMVMAEKSTRWQYQDEDGIWYYYSSEMSAKISRAKQAGAASIQWSERENWQLNTYSLDFRKMRVCSSITGCFYKVREV